MKGKWPTSATLRPRPRSASTWAALISTAWLSSTSSSELMAATPMLASSGLSERAYSASSRALFRCSRPTSRTAAWPWGLSPVMVEARPQPRLHTTVQCAPTSTVRTGASGKVGSKSSRMLMFRLLDRIFPLRQCSFKNLNLLMFQGCLVDRPSARKPKAYPLPSTANNRSPGLTGALAGNAARPSSSNRARPNTRIARCAGSLAALARPKPPDVRLPRSRSASPPAWKPYLRQAAGGIDNVNLDRRSPNRRPTCRL